MNIFGYPYWTIDSAGNLTPVVPSGVPETGSTPAVDPGLIPDLIAGAAPGMDGTPFFEIVVKNSPLGGSMITWGLKRGFNDPLPYQFQVYWAETPMGPFTAVDHPALINTYWAVDPTQRLFAMDIESYYAIRLTTPNGEYWSFASSANANWSKKDWLIGREICRKEFLLFRKYTGWQGFLLKRKIWGATCPRCGDFDTQEPSDGHCLVCYGTGKDGGYWSPFPTFTYSIGGGPTHFKQADDNTSLSENIVMQNMRMLGYPHLATNDVFIHYGSGRRYFVRPVKMECEIKGIPIVYMCELRQAPFTDVIYKYPYQPVPEPVPEPPAPPESESEPIVPAGELFKIQWSLGEWRLGLDLDHVLYRTTGGYPLANGLDSFTWVAADGTASSLVVTEQDTGYTVSGDVLVAGTYVPNGESEGLTLFERVIND